MDDDEIVIEEEADAGAETIKKLRERLKKCETDKQDYLAGWQRAKADFINARKDEEASRGEFIKFSEKNLIFDLLDLADSFDGLFNTKEKIEEINPEWRKGIENIYQQLLNILKSRGVEIIKSIGEKFNPEEHESVGEIKIDNPEKEGIIVEEIRKGYKMHNKIIRPSQVKISKYE